MIEAKPRARRDVLSDCAQIHADLFTRVHDRFARMLDEVFVCHPQWT